MLRKAGKLSQMRKSLSSGITNSFNTSVSLINGFFSQKRGGPRVVAITVLTLHTEADVFISYFKRSWPFKLRKTGFRVWGKKRGCLF